MSKTLIQTIAVGAGGSGNITFNNIPQTYTHLQLVISCRGTANGNNLILVQPNGVATDSYANRQLRGETGVSVATWAGVTAFVVGMTGGTNIAANIFTTTTATFPNYTVTGKKTFSSEYSKETNDTVTFENGIGSGLLNNTAPITSLVLSLYLNGYTFAEGSTASLYGVSKVLPTGSGATPNVEYLVVAGGGGGGGYVGGGGGAGGLLTGPSLAVTSGSAITVTVGAGGAGAPSAGGARGSNGSSSTLLSISPVGGGGGSVGGGGSTNIGPGQNGGSGGGGGSSTGNLVGGSGTAGQGYAGGSSSGMSGDYGSGGGGGYASIGETPTAGTGGGDGGSGASSTITGAMAYYSGGGGGANGNAYGASIPGNGGIGGGGRGTLHNMADGQVVTAGTPGVANTGGGAGGGGVAVNSQAQGMQGGSGVVIIRYPDNYANPTATTGNPVVNYANGYKIYTWTASGSITF